MNKYNKLLHVMDTYYHGTDVPKSYLLNAVRELRAEAWDEGYDEAAHWKYPEDHKRNPYREEAGS